MDTKASHSRNEMAPAAPRPGRYLGYGLKVGLALLCIAAAAFVVRAFYDQHGSYWLGAFLACSVTYAFGATLLSIWKQISEQWKWITGIPSFLLLGVIGVAIYASDAGSPDIPLYALIIVSVVFAFQRGARAGLNTIGGVSASITGWPRIPRWAVKALIASYITNATIWTFLVTARMWRTPGSGYGYRLIMAYLWIFVASSWFQCVAITASSKQHMRGIET